MGIITDVNIDNSIDLDYNLARLFISMLTDKNGKRANMRVDDNFDLVFDLWLAYILA